MNYIYLPTTNAINAQNLSRLLFQLSRPLHIRDSLDVVEYYCNWIVHPTNETAVVHFPLEDLYIHPEADIETFISFFDLYISLGIMTLAEKENIQVALQNNLGNHLFLYDHLPAWWLNNAKTLEQVTAAGYFGGGFE